MVRKVILRHSRSLEQIMVTREATPNQRRATPNRAFENGRTDKRRAVQRER